MASPFLQLLNLTAVITLVGLVACSDIDHPGTRIKQEPAQKSTAEPDNLCSLVTGFYSRNGILGVSPVLLEISKEKNSGSNTKVLATEVLRLKLSDSSVQPPAVELEVEIPEISKTLYKLKPITSNPQSIHISLEKSFLQLLILADSSDQRKIKIYIRSLPVPDENNVSRKIGIPTLVLIEKTDTGFHYISSVTANKYQTAPTLALTPPVELSEYSEQQIQPIPVYDK